MTPLKYPHLLPSVQLLADAPSEARIRHIRADRWIGYGRAEMALAELEDLLSFPERTRMPNLILVGSTNNGKTMIVEKFRRRHLPNNDLFDPQCVLSAPILKVQMPAAPDERHFFAAILTALGATDQLNDRLVTKQSVAVRLMRAALVRVLIIDELHNVLAGSRDQQRRFLNLLRWLGNELRIPIVAVGTAEALRAVQSDDQLANRFTPFHLPLWTADAEYLRLLNTLEAVLPLRRPSALSEPAMAHRILTAAEGVLGEIVAILMRSAVRAIVTGEEAIDSSILDQIHFIPPTQRRHGSGQALDVEVLQFAPQGMPDGPTHLPVLAAPFTDEALAGWVHRFARPLDVPPSLLLFELADRPFIARRAWWHRPPTALLERLARRTGLSMTDIEAMTFSHWTSDAASNEAAERFARVRAWHLPHVSYPLHSYAVCTRCLAEDPVPYIRKTWTLGWFGVCETHGLVLVTDCPECRLRFRIPSLIAKETFRPDHCQCGRHLSGVVQRPGHELAIRLQRALLTGSKQADIHLPALGMLQWPLAMALFDVLLDMMWFEAVPRSEHPLFACMKEDLRLTAGLGTESYDGLLILAWLLEQWPQRVHAAVATLGVVCPRRTNKRWQYLHPEIKRDVEALLKAARVHAGAARTP